MCCCYPPKHRLVWLILVIGIEHHEFRHVLGTSIRLVDWFTKLVQKLTVVHLGLTIWGHQGVIEIDTLTWVLTRIIGIISNCILIPTDITWLLFSDGGLVPDCCLLLHQRVLEVGLVNFGDSVFTAQETVSLWINHQRIIDRTYNIWVCIDRSVIIRVLVDALNELL